MNNAFPASWIFKPGSRASAVYEMCLNQRKWHNEQMIFHVGGKRRRRRRGGGRELEEPSNEKPNEMCINLWLFNSKRKKKREGEVWSKKTWKKLVRHSPRQLSLLFFPRLPASPRTLPSPHLSHLHLFHFFFGSPAPGAERERREINK